MTYRVGTGVPVVGDGEPHLLVISMHLRLSEAHQTTTSRWIVAAGK